jgi:hypothetical protein
MRDELSARNHAVDDRRMGVISKLEMASPFGSAAIGGVIKDYHAR